MDGIRGSGDVGVDAFAERNLVSFASWDLIVYLSRHPGVEDELSDLCTALSRTERDVVPALQHAIATGVVEKRTGDDGRTRYRLTPDETMRSVIADFVQLAGVREVRLEFVRRVLSRLSS